MTCELFPSANAPPEACVRGGVGVRCRRMQGPGGAAGLQLQERAAAAAVRRRLTRARARAQDVLVTLLNNLKVQERQNRVCTTVAIAIVAETCSPFTVLPALMNEYKARRAPPPPGPRRAAPVQPCRPPHPRPAGTAGSPGAERQVRHACAAA